MKCPTCGADTRVLETRATNTHATRRTRECFNNHRFTTLEAVESAVQPSALARREQTIRNRHAREARDRAIRRSNLPARTLTAQYNLSLRSIQRILKFRNHGGKP